MKKLICIVFLCVGFSSCAQKPGSGGGWVVGNPMMPEGMAQDAAEQPFGEQAVEPCLCKTKKKCDCSNKSR